MKAVKELFYLYIHGSIHVAVAVLCLVLMTNHMFALRFDTPMAGLAFFGTVFGYNFIKYEALFRTKKTIGTYTKIIAVISLLALSGAGISFFFLEGRTQITALIFLGLTVLYAVPFTKKGNLRNLGGIKIYIVALCWAGITTLMPLINAGVALYSDVYLKFCQRFLLVIILILIFEIIDLKEDNPSLKTVPQKIGIKKTQLLNILLLAIFYSLEFLKQRNDNRQLLVNVALVLAVGLFTFGASPKRSKYYTLFWVESVPIFWLGLIYLAAYL